MVKVTDFYCKTCHHEFVPTKKQILSWHNKEIKKPDICGFCNVIISEKERNTNMKDLNIDPSDEPSNTKMFIYLIIVVIALMIFYRIISGVNSREDARKINTPLPGYNRQVSEMVHSSL